MLRGDAERWWEAARTRFAEREPAWADFLQVFNEAYCPKWVREQKVYQFIELQQGANSVALYETEFVALSRYAPDMISTEVQKAAKFQRGLRADIRHTFAGVRVVDYATVVQRAYAIERDQNEIKGQQTPKDVSKSSGKKRKWEGKAGGSGGA